MIIFNLVNCAIYYFNRKNERVLNAQFVNFKVTKDERNAKKLIKNIQVNTTPEKVAIS